MERNRLLTWEEAVLWLKRQPEQQDLVRACFYDDPLLHAAARYWVSTEWRAVREFLPVRTGKALDVGAGRGISSYALARDGWRVTALEPDPSLKVGAGAIRALADEANLEIDTVEKWGEQLPFDDNVFDVVHCRQVLHHARNLGGLCKEIGRVLRKGGCFIATREHVISRREDLPIFLDKHPLHKLYGGENAFLLKEYVDSIRSGGIQLQHVLNPLETNINVFPDTLDRIKRQWASKLGWPLSSWIPDTFLAWKGSLSNCPGRVYTFVGHKA